MVAFQSSKMKVTPSSLVMGYMRLGDGSTAAIAFAAWSKGMPAASPTASAARTAEVQCVPHSRVLTSPAWPWWTAVKDSRSGQVEQIGQAPGRERVCPYG